jgi:hypothetical protein
LRRPLAYSKRRPADTATEHAINLLERAAAGQVVKNDPLQTQGDFLPLFVKQGHQDESEKDEAEADVGALRRRIAARRSQQIVRE